MSLHFTSYYKNDDFAEWTKQELDVQLHIWDQYEYPTWQEALKEGQLHALDHGELPIFGYTRIIDLLEFTRKTLNLCAEKQEGRPRKMFWVVVREANENLPLCESDTWLFPLNADPDFEASCAAIRSGYSAEVMDKKYEARIPLNQAQEQLRKVT